jgi:hypothetical protein
MTRLAEVTASIETARWRRILTLLGLDGRIQAAADLKGRPGSLFSRPLRHVRSHVPYLNRLREAYPKAGIFGRSLRRCGQVRPAAHDAGIDTRS